MTNSQSTIETLILAGGAGAVLYFGYTRAGREKLRRFEQWIEEGTAGSTRLMDVLERVAMITAAVGGVVGLVNKAAHDTGAPEGRSAAIEQLLALPSALGRNTAGARR
jgi:hypothetical protein